MVCEFVIGAKEREVGNLHAVAQSLDSIVELVIANCHSIDMHAVHELHLELPLEEVEIWCSLEHVSTLENQDILFTLGLHDLLDEGLASGVATLTSIFGVGVGEGVYVAMYIVGMEDCKTGFASLANGARREG